MSRERDPLRVFIVNQFLHWFIVGISFPVLILILLEKGIDLFGAGTIMACYSATTIILELPTGGLADTIGRKKTYLISTCFALCAAVALLISWDLVTGALALIIYGVARALSSGSMDAWFVDEYKKAHGEEGLQKALAKAGVFLPLAIAAGSLLGGALPMFFGALQVGDTGPYSFNILLMIALLFVQLIVTAIIVREAPCPVGGRAFSLEKLKEVFAVSARHGLHNRITLVLLLSMAALGFGVMSIELLWHPRVQEISVATDTWVLGLLAAAYFLASAMGSLAATRLSDRTSQVWTMAALRLATGIIFIFFALQTQLFGFALFYVVLYFVASVGDSPHAALYNAQAPSEVRATLLSLQSLVIQLGALVGSLVLGFVASNASISVAWIVGGAVVCASCLCYVYLGGLMRRRGHTKDQGSHSQ
ncbi:MAG: MFS transporter [Methanomassiliicoccales archaeon]